MRDLVVKLLAATACAVLPAAAAAQAAYPTKPVRLIVPFPPGGSTDVVARLVAAKVSDLWGATIVVENRSGASGTIGAAEGMAAASDGYTLTLGNSQTHGMNAALFPSLRFDSIKDVQPIAMLVRTRNVLAVGGSSPYRTAQELLDAGKKNHVTYASVGLGSTSHIIGHFLEKHYALKATHVPYRGASPAITDLIGGQVTFMAATYGSVGAYRQSGKVRLLAIAGDERDPRIPDVPSFTEVGIPDLGLDTTTSLFGPAGVPAEIVKKWSDTLAKVVAMPDFASAVEKGGFSIHFKPAEEFSRLYVNEVPRLGKIIRDANIKLE